MRMRHASGSLVRIIAPTHTADDLAPILPVQATYEIASLRCKKFLNMYLAQVPTMKCIH